MKITDLMKTFAGTTALHCSQEHTTAMLLLHIIVQLYIVQLDDWQT